MNAIVLLNILLSLTAISFTSHAANKFDTEVAKIIERNFPSEFKELKDENSGKKLTLEDGLGYQFEYAYFSGPNKERYIVVTYKAALSTSYVKCKLVVFKSDGTLLPKTELQREDSISGCTDPVFKDLDGDQIPEVLVSLMNWKAQILSTHIFLWSKDHLVEALPAQSEQDSKTSIPSDLDISNAQIDGKTLLIGYPDKDSEEIDATKVFILKDNKITPYNKYDYMKLLKASKKKKEIKIDFSVPGQYDLELINVSSAKQLVKASLSINGSAAVKFQSINFIKQAVTIKESNSLSVTIDGPKDGFLLLALTLRP